MSEPLLASTTAFSTAAATVKPIVDKNTPKPVILGNLTTNVPASGALIFSFFRPMMSVNKKAGDLFNSIARVQEYNTSSAVTGLPLANLAFAFSLKVTASMAPSSLVVHDSANSGFTPGTPGSGLTRVS